MGKEPSWANPFYRHKARARWIIEATTGDDARYKLALVHAALPGNGFEYIHSNMQEEIANIEGGKNQTGNIHCKVRGGHWGSTHKTQKGGWDASNTGHKNMEAGGPTRPQ